MLLTYFNSYRSRLRNSALSMAPFIENISKYLTSQSTTLTWSKFRKHCGSHLPYKGTTCLTIICYAIKLCYHSEHVANVIARLDSLASQFFVIEMMFMSGQVMENAVWEKDHEICESFVICFQPLIHELFMVPRMEELSDEDKTRKKNERLAGFFDFVLQILNSEDKEEMYVVVRTELTFVLTFLGDTPFRDTEFEIESVRNVLVEFENLGNEVGKFVYSCVLVKPRVYEGVDDVLKRFEILSSKIKQHCVQFVEFREFESLRRGDTFDSLFIVDSLIEDIENLMVRRFYSTADCITDGIKKHREELTYRRTLLEDSGEMQVMDTDGLRESLTQVRNGVDSLLEDLENLMYRQYRFPNDNIQTHVKALHWELMSCRDLLEDGGEMQVETDELRESRIQIRDGAYEAEYLINAHVVGNLPTWYLNLRLPVVTQKINLTRRKLQTIKKNCMSIDGSGVRKGFPSEESLQVNKTSRGKANSMIIGFEDHRTKILGDLIGGSRKLQTVSVFGMPGLGKTTIANELYSDSVYDYFDIRVWCVVSQMYEKRKVLNDILTSLERRPGKNRNLEMDDESLGLAIYQSLKGRRYLVVLDDVWHSSTLDDLRRYFPDDRLGSRIMLTSRIKDIAPTSSIFHTLPLLSEVQCWNLLVEKTIGEGPCSPQLLDIARRIANQCRGLPLAVVVIAGVLANLDKAASVWKKVESNLDSYICNDPSDYMRILHLSYEHLSNHLKLCFLYMGAFREDTEIPVQKLTHLLIAEGFIPKKDDKCLELVAYGYILELVNRSLIMIASKSFDGGIKSCRMHDLLRDMCLRRANEENFLKPVCYPSIYEKHHRLYAHFTTPICSWSIFGLHCRSFSGYLPAPASRLPQMPLLRVMDLYPTAYSNEEAKSVDRLVHLRYLAIGGLPEQIHKLINLEFLCIETEAKVRFPLSILKALSKLKHLHITRRIKFEVEQPNSSHEVHLLKSLSYVQIYKHEDGDVLRHLPHLRKLKCICNEKLFPDLRFINELQSLNMTFKGYFSGELAIVIPQTLRKLHLQGTGLPWEKMAVVARLPNLGALKVCYDAFVGEEWTTVDGEFQELRLLKLEEISLKKWITCSKHFPKLRNLVLKSCRDFFEIPSELGEVPTLQVIEVNDSSRDACLSAIRIEKEQLEYGNEILKVKISLHQWSKDELMLQELGH